MFNHERERASRTDTVTLRPARGRWVPDRLADRDILRLHDLPTCFPDHEQALEAISRAGLWVSTAPTIGGES